MLISDGAIKRPVITVVAMVALVIFGLFSLLTLKTDEYPDVAPPYVSVGVPYPGASPETVEKEVLDPIEEAISSITGVKKVTGNAMDGFANILIEFQFTKPLPEATQDIRDAISSIRNELPLEMKEPIIRKLNDTDRPIFSFALSSTELGPRELTRVADPSITRELRSIPGVAEVTISGKQVRELTIELMPEALQAAGVSVAEVVQALSLQNLAAPVGRLEGVLDERSIRLKGRMENPAEFAQLVVSDRNGKLIRLGDLANVRDGSEEPRTMALFNGRQAVGIDIKKAKGYSTAEVSEAILARLGRVKHSLPANVRLDIIKDAAIRVAHSVRNVQETLFEGALLTVLVVFLFLNSWRSTVITGLALPVSVLAAFIAVWIFGFTLNTMSLLGLSLAIGILIDDAIVVRENIVRHVEMGKDHITAAHEGTDEIGVAVTATTLSILAVFVPIAFLPGLSGQWFKPFGLTMACAVAVSLLVSFSLDPMLSAYWPDPHRAEDKKGWITRKLDRFNDGFKRLAERYKRVIAWALDHRMAVAALSAGTFFFALAMPALRLVGVSFVPIDDRSEMTIQVETPPSSNLEYTRRKAEEIDKLLRAHPEVQYTYATLGASTTGAVDQGNIYVRMTPKHERKISAEAFAGTFRREVGGVAGAKVAVFTSDIGGGRKQLQLEVRGDNLATLATIADRVQAEVAKVPGAVDIALSSKGQKPEVSVELNRGLAGSLGVTVAQVAQSLRPAFAGIDAGDWLDPSGQTRDVVVRFSPEARRRLTDLRELPLTIRGGANGAPTTVPLGQVATISQGVGPAVIDHLNRDLVVIVGWNASGRSTGEVMADVLRRTDAIALPQGVSITQGGDAESQNEVFGNIFFALGIALLFMYLILAIQFGSFIDPLAIMMSLPLSLIGVMLALAVTGTSINIMSLIGVILLMGIVAKNAILLIDFAKWAREKDGLALREALIEAGAIRLRPILMTTFALIAGMLPVALGTGEGAQFRSPLGIAVIGGVITSTFLTLVAIPTFYEILDETREKVMRVAGRFFKGRRPSAAHPTISEEPR
ncbi:MAG: efflux RND transporter permease subunit [Gemmatimonadales bacterium]|nr:efflux RND transporter permease subunit [Gemmatimonadales bacterium]